MLFIDYIQHYGVVYGFIAAASLVAAIVIGLTLHEYSHARSAYAFGDLTAYLAGRMKLDPRVHIDPFGALFFLIVGFGWAKPVPIDPYRLGRGGTVAVSAAGPGSNVLLAFLFVLPLRLGLLSQASILGSFLLLFAYLNIMLAVFNSLPIPPLDGWRVVTGFVPVESAYRLREVERYSFVVLMGIMMIGVATGTPLFYNLMKPFIQALAWLVAGPELAASMNL
jgi:Zn-dependent protease